MRVLPVISVNVNRGSLEVTRKNEGMLPPQSMPVGGRLCQFVEGWKRITNDLYVLSITENSGNARANFLMLQKKAISEISPDTPGFYSNIFEVHKASGGWHPVIDLKQLNHHINAPHFRMHTINSVPSTVERGDYTFNIDLQDAYFDLLIRQDSGKYLRFAF